MSQDNFIRESPNTWHLISHFCSKQCIFLNKHYYCRRLVYMSSCLACRSRFPAQLWHLQSVNTCNPLTLLSQKSSCTLDATNPPKSPNKEKFLKRNAVQRPKETFVKRKTIIRRQVNQPHHVIKTKWTAPRETIALQNLMRRFPSALKQINKRLVSQNLLWYTLNNRRH